MKPVRVVAALAVTMCGVLLPATAASAHADLLATTPPSGTHLDQPPADVTLQFTERVIPVPGQIRLLNSAGRRVGDAQARQVPEHPDQIRVPMPDDLADGIYVVAWRVESLDAHPVGGSLTFSVGAAGDSAGDGAALASGAGPGQVEEEQDPAVGTVFWLFRGLGYVSLALLAGGLSFLLLCWPAGYSDLRVRRLLGAGWLTGLVSAAAVLLLQGPYVAGESLGTLLDPTLLRATVDTEYGRLVVARLVLLGLAGLLLYRLLGSRRSAPVTGRRQWTLATAGLVAVALPVTWASTGHARAGTSPVFALLSDTGHLLAMSAWLGGLAFLFYCVLPARRALPAADVLAVLPRFSRLALAAVGVLLVTGVFQAWRELRDTGLSEGSGYTRLLVFKLAAFGLLLCLGAGSRALVQYRYARPAAALVAGSAGAAHPPQAAKNRVTKKLRHAEQQRDAAALTLLRRSVRLEVGIAATVLGLTAAIVSTSPTGHDHSTPEPNGGDHGPATALLALPGGGDVQVWIDPARPGRNQMVLNVRDRGGLNRDVPEVRAQLNLPALGAAPMPVPLNRTAPGRFTTQALTLPLAGTWQLVVRVRTSEIDENSVSTQIPVS